MVAPRARWTDVMGTQVRRQFQELKECRAKRRELEAALKDLLADLLEVPVDKLDPKDVMRYHRLSYDALYVHG